MRKIPVPDGAKLYVTATLAAAVGTGTATNAASAVVTIEDHGIASDALVLIDSEDWPELAGRVARVTVSANAVTLQGIDTTNTDKYPAGGKLALTVLPADASYTRLPYVTALGVSGGELQTGTSEYLDVETAGEYATGRSPAAWSTASASTPMVQAVLHCWQRTANSPCTSWFTRTAMPLTTLASCTTTTPQH